MPHNEDGIRIDPPVSEPTDPNPRLRATAVPDPPLDPPAIRSLSHGFRVVPKWGLTVVTPNANSWRLVLPTITAPASRSLVTTAASSEGTLLAKIFAPAVVRVAAVSYRSLTERGTPLRARIFPPMISRSTARAVFIPS